MECIDQILFRALVLTDQIVHFKAEFYGFHLYCRTVVALYIVEQQCSAVMKGLKGNKCHASFVKGSNQ